MPEPAEDKTKKNEDFKQLSEGIFYGTYFNDEWLRYQKNQNKTALFFKIYVFFGFPIPNGKSLFHVFIGSPQSKLSYLIVPFVVLFNIVRLLVVTSINILKLFTEFGPECLRVYAKRYASDQDERRRQHRTNYVFFATLLHRLAASLSLLGLSTTSPIKAMRRLGKQGSKLGEGHGKFIETSLWLLFSFFSLALTTTIYTFILPFAIQAVVIHFPVAAAAAVSFFASNFPNLIAIGIAASPIIMAGVEAFGAIVLALILLTDMATTSLAQKCIGDKIEKALLKEAEIGNTEEAQVEANGYYGSSLEPDCTESFESDEFLLVETSYVDPTELEEGSSNPLFQRKTSALPGNSTQLPDSPRPT